MQKNKRNIQISANQPA